jgi:hypothetical protein
MTTSQRGILRKVFLHKVGHIHGPRHEFAIEKEHYRAVQFMETNTDSVMNYNPKPIVQ